MDAAYASEILAQPDADPAAIHDATSGAAQLGRDVSPREAIRQVVVWLRDTSPEAWADTDEGRLQQIAWSLLVRRGRIEARRLGER